ncbi:uncharacterized protein LOC113238449 [Hyposmocoma kahamanoa]|uniref:uncharacterized protein LOC113238449 n=1 Tax=Hyposmocoma kahamanoa TaxID=1477025 RepID=UPI000E6D9E0E|nr:uncharacterized protein LOC113238449 [Hyposmocoma kahamanoa]
MCSVEKCCYCLPLDLACIIIGIVSLIFSGVLTVVSIVFLSLDIRTDFQLESNPAVATDQHKLQSLLNISISVEAIRIVLCVILAVSALATVASVSLMIGLQKRRSGFVLFYFGYWVFLTIVLMLGGILVLIEKHWAMALLLFGASLILIHMLVVVNAVYDGLQRGKVFGISPHRRLSEDTDALTTSMHH